jgi:hypothetical protein
MATATVTPKRNGKKAAKATTSKPAQKQEVEVQRMAYQGYCIAAGFDRSLVKAQELLKQAKAKDKDGLYRWHLYLVTPNREHAKGTKQARLAAKSAA